MHSITTQQLIKIGIATTKKDLNRRFYGLRNDGYKGQQFEGVAYCESPKYKEIETLFKQIFHKSKIGNTELYDIEVEKMVELFSFLKWKTTIIKEYAETEKSDSNKQRRLANVKRSELGIHRRQVLYFYYKNKLYKDIVATNIDDRWIEYEGKNYSISKLATKILVDKFHLRPRSINGNDFWSIDGNVTLARLSVNKGLRLSAIT